MQVEHLNQTKTNTQQIKLLKTQQIKLENIIKANISPFLTKP